MKTIDDGIINAIYKRDVINKHYLRRYLAFIAFARQADFSKYAKFETHHIVPKSWGGTNSKHNLIKLPIKWHIVAHQLLARTQDKSMMIAFHRIVSRDVETASFVFKVDSYESIKANMSLALSRRIVNLSTGQEFENAGQCIEYYEDYNSTPSTIHNCIRNVTKYYGDYYQYCDVVQAVGGIQQMIDNIKQYKKLVAQKRIENIRKFKQRPVVNLNTLQIFETGLIASQSLGYKSNVVGYSIKHNKLCNNCNWQYLDMI